MRRIKFSGKRWPYMEFQGIQIYDKRRVRSVIRMSAAIFANQGKAFSVACGPVLRQNGGKILADDRVTPAAIQESHYRQTARRAAHYRDIIVVQDTSSVSYSSHKSVTGLGYINDHANSRGIKVHTSLVLSDDTGLPLGVIGQDLWTCDLAERGKTKLRKSRSIEEKESYKWLKGLDYVEARLAKATRSVWVVSDRESDIFAYLMHPRSAHVNLIFRAGQSRVIEAEIEGAPLRGQLPNVVKRLPVVARKKVVIERPGRVETVEASISYANALLRPPEKLGVRTKPIAISVIYVREIDQARADKIDWILIVTKQNLTEQEVLAMITRYEHRWKIESFHFTLKSGAFNVERLMFDDAHTLKNALAFYSVLAWRALFTLYYARVYPGASAEMIVSPVEKEVLEEYFKKKY